MVTLIFSCKMVCVALVSLANKRFFSVARTYVHKGGVRESLCIAQGG